MDVYLKAQLKQVVGYASVATTDVAGQVQIGSIATVFSRVQPRYREVPVGTVIEERTTHMIILDETFPLTEAQSRGALFWLPSEPLSDSASGRRPKVTHYCYDEYGALSHVEITV